MEVILKEDVANLGHRGDVVKVADGYGRNFLLPRKLALQATDANKAVVETMKTAAARRSASEKVQAEELVAKLAPIVISFTRKSGETGQLFGSVTSADVAGELAVKGFDVDRRKIQLNEPIKTVGDHDVAIKLHREVTAHVKVKVVAEAGVATETAAVEPAAEAVAKLDPDRSPPDRFAVLGKEVYMHLLTGAAKTKLTNAWMDSKLSTVSTARNWATVLKLHELTRG